MSIATLRKLNSQKWGIEKEFSKEIKKTFPKRSRVEFEQGNGIISATIIDRSGDRVKIKNLRTDKEYWIDAYWLIR